jgi:transposase
MAIWRFEAAPNVKDLADELGVRRELLYKWRAKYATEGEGGLRTSGRPRPVGAAPEALAAEQRIAELERKLGQQELLLDFFRGALRRIEGSRQASEVPGATASSPRSKR